MANSYANENMLKNIQHVFETDFDIFNDLRRVCKGIVQIMPSPELAEKIGVTKVWANHKISIFKYLMIINILAGRSLKDISAYPIFPWVLKDYNSETIYLNDPSVYRDLSRPIGTLNDEILENLGELKQELGGANPTEDCLYRTHMSNVGYSIGFLIRIELFTTLHISLQSGKYDCHDMLFYDIPKTWSSVTGMMNDFRELIPQFFCFPEFLKNDNGFDLGRDVNGTQLADVVLPKWAKSAEEFVSINRRALESGIVGQNLGAWIDIVFSINRMSEECHNVFHPLSYDAIVENYIDLPEYRELVKSHCANFGTYPHQVFMSPHQNRAPNAHNQSFTKCEGRVVTGEPRLLESNVYAGSDGTLHDLRSEASFQLSKKFNQYTCFAYSEEHKLLFGVSAGTLRGCTVWNTQTEDQ